MINKKDEALKRMKMLELHENVLKEFDSENKINLSENGGALYWLNDKQKKIVTDFEEKTGYLVYHIIHSFTRFGELYNILYISNYEDEWESEIQDLRDGYLFAYVKNIDDDYCSEYGSIGYKKRIGGLVRIG